MSLGVLEIRAGAGLSGLGCFWDVVVIGGDFEAGDHQVINLIMPAARARNAQLLSGQLSCPAFRSPIFDFYYCPA